MILDWARGVAGGDLSTKSIADIGCGPGTTLDWLEGTDRLVGLDLSTVALNLAKEATGANLIQGNATSLPLRDEGMDMVLALDMFEHLEDPESAASEVFRILQPGGWLVATVPAWPFLASTHDVALGHYRRYRRENFEKLLQGAGFHVERVSYYNFFLFPVVAMVRMMKGHTVELGSSDAQPEVESDLREIPGFFNKILEELLAGERHLLRHMNLPVGVSLIARAQRR